MSSLAEESSLLIFLYDTQLAQSEADDPLESTLYFYPHAASNLERRVTVIGQIIGTALCLQKTFDSPKLICLDHGKFALSWSGRLVLVVGSSQPVPNQVIINQRDFVCRLLHGKFGELSEYHSKSIEFNTEIEVFFAANLRSILEKWAALTSHPETHLVF